MNRDRLLELLRAVVDDAFAVRPWSRRRPGEGDGCAHGRVQAFDHGRSAARRLRLPLRRIERADAVASVSAPKNDPSARTVPAPRPTSTTPAAGQRGSAFAQFAILLASIGMIALAVLQFVRA